MMLPPEITSSSRCVVWNRETRNGKPTKVPYDPKAPHRRAAVDDPSTWGTFAEAERVVAAGLADGVGIVLGDGIVGVDLDHCRDAHGILEPNAAAIVAHLDSYAEVSPSGDGVHVLCRGVLPKGGRKRGPIELYDAGRYFTITGQRVPGARETIEERTAQLATLHAKVFPKLRLVPERRAAIPCKFAGDRDDQLLARAHTARNGTKFAALWRGDWSAYPSPSEADQALCNILALWTRGDAARVDRLFRRSGLMRPKWDEPRGEQTYGQRTIAKAIVPLPGSVAG